MPLVFCRLPRSHRRSAPARHLLRTLTPRSTDVIHRTSFLRSAAAAFCFTASMLAGAVSAETLRFGATATGIPFTFLDVKTNKIEGMMVDTAHAVAKAAGYDATIQQNVFSALIPALTSDKIDVISAAMIQSPERAKVVSFT